MCNQCATYSINKGAIIDVTLTTPHRLDFICLIGKGIYSYHCPNDDDFFNRFEIISNFKEK